MTIKLAEDQTRAIEKILDWVDGDEMGFSVNARAGSGKSTMLAFLKQRLLDKGKFLYVATLTNKSAAILNQMDSTMGATTIHSLLSIRPKVDYQTGKEEFVPDYGNQQKLPPRGSLIAVDESSMGSESLQNVLAKHSNDHEYRWIFLGDEYQLPPVGEPLSTLLYITPSADLTSIKRHDSAILALSSHLADCVSGTSSFNGFDKFLCDEIVEMNSRQFLRDLKSTAKGVYSSRSPNIDEMRYIAWTNRKCLSIGREISDYLGRKDGVPFEDDLMISNGSYTDPSDSMIFLGNNVSARVFDIERCTFREMESNLPGFEYSIPGCDFRLFTPLDFTRAGGYFKKMGEKCRKEQNWRPFFLAKNSIIDLRQPYISTVHCSQGSSFKEAFIDVPDIMKNRDPNERLRLLYVACSRAVNKITLLK